MQIYLFRTRRSPCKPSICYYNITNFESSFYCKNKSSFSKFFYLKAIFTRPITAIAYCSFYCFADNETTFNAFPVIVSLQIFLHSKRSCIKLARLRTASNLSSSVAPPLEFIRSNIRWHNISQTVPSRGGPVLYCKRARAPVYTAHT